MKIFLLNSEIKKIFKHKKELEKKLNVSIVFEKNFVSVEGNVIDEYAAEQIIRALAVGFNFKIALFLEDPDYLFEEINIKKYASGKRLQQIKARIIGTRGRALKTLMQLTDCMIVLYENRVAMIGRTENIKFAIQSVQSIVYGSKHGNVYARLERLMSKPEENDLGLREIKKPVPKKKIEKKKAL